ncbi:MAG: hypothetical protein HYV07_09960 [Deltaproteobacteria bacterium]|nr:hypothetical protein [Deltaproteobacteria bacterium]
MISVVDVESGRSRRAVGRLWKSVAQMFRPPRRLRPTRAGAFTLAAPFFLGLAAISATNNLLFVLLGVSLGLIVLSGIFSERNLSGIRARLEPSGEVRAEETARLLVTFEREDRGYGPAYGVRLRARRSKVDSDRIDVTLPVLEGSEASCIARKTFPRRGLQDVRDFELLTDFPFGLFNKIRDVDVSSMVLVWPRRIEVPPELADPRGIAAEGRATGARGAGQDVYGLRERTEWDSPHRVHALRSLSVGRELVVETETTTRAMAWLGIANDEGVDEAALERAIEIAAAVLEAWDRLGYAVGLVTFGRVEKPGTATLSDVLDALASIEPMRAELRRLEAAPVWLIPDGASIGEVEGASVFDVAASGELTAREHA